MNQLIYNAIRERRVLSFDYHGHHRIMEPHAYGLSLAGNEIVRCYQTRGTSEHGTVPSWKICLIAEISGLADTGEHFSGKRDGYARGDKKMTKIFVEL